jgi:endonuclease/exonuclease/phosphatase family metal-dependent hydrolase
MSTFRATLEALEVKELQLHGRQFTWTCDTANPTQTKIDHVFSTKEWELTNPNCYLQTLGSLMSDHCPMILTSN